ncbi:hypothetical protein [Paenibacillus sp. 481]|uniref:hypothetical protein n=1 Tax=Paenibacillus sp. 481 TaxID=2835869 RepID=UPI001E5C02CC|nr:hypothetical protein [Paenibacillus sp. 481]UHA72839.1 hypothetical protein KIK04_19760 [Paenibacillus sp. 481]
MIVTTFSLYGCNSSNASVLDWKELNRLRQENEALKKELQKYKTTKPELLQEALTRYDQKDLTRLKELKSLAEQLFPGTKETKQIAAITHKLDNGLKQALAIATSKMKKMVDEVTGYTSYQDKSSPTSAAKNSIHLFFLKRDKDRAYELYTRIQHSGSMTVGLDEVEIRADGKYFSISVVPEEVKRNYNFVEIVDQSGVPWEQYDSPVSWYMDLDMIHAIISSKKAIMRYKGRSLHVDRTITAAEKKAMRHVMDAFKAVGGLDNDDFKRKSDDS